MENDVVKEDGVISDDDEGREEFSNILAGGETSSDENLNEDLDFYDFLEAVSDKIDTITNQSKKPPRSFVCNLVSSRRSSREFSATIATNNC